jgi:hypothetical protein
VQQRVDRRGVRGDVQARRVLPLLHGPLDQRLHWIAGAAVRKRLVEYRGHGLARLWIAHMGPQGWGDGVCHIHSASEIRRHQPVGADGGAGQQFPVCLFGQHVFAHGQVGGGAGVLGVPIHQAR